MSGSWACSWCGSSGTRTVETMDVGIQTDDSSTMKLIASLQFELAQTKDRLQAALWTLAMTGEQPNHRHELQSPAQLPLPQAPGIPEPQPVRCTPTYTSTAQAPESSESREAEFSYVYVQSCVKVEEEQLQSQFPDQAASGILSQGPAEGDSDGRNCRNGADSVQVWDNSPELSPAPSVGIDEDPLRLTPHQAPDSDAADSHTELDGRGGDNGSDKDVADKSPPVAKYRKCHPKVRRFPCPCCDKAFFTEKDMMKHKARHQGGKPFTCNLCQSPFRSSLTLRRHMAATHSLGSTRNCPHCDKAFGSINDLKRHIYVHTGERPYACNQCDQSFRQPAGLRVHQRVHHGLPQEQHLCTTCGRNFAGSRSLDRHILLIHTGERPFLCPDCGRTFRQQASLQTHRRIHSKKQPKKFQNITSAV